MSYATIEAAVKSVIELHADYDSTNVDRNDRRILAGSPARAVVITYNSHTQEELTFQRLMVTWNVNVDVYAPWAGEQPNWLENLDTERQKIIGQIAAYPRLNAASGVLDAAMVAGATPPPARAEDGRYVIQRLTCQVKEVVDPARVE